jgi:hypothetical protein
VARAGRIEVGSFRDKMKLLFELVKNVFSLGAAVCMVMFTPCDNIERNGSQQAVEFEDKSKTLK